MALVASFRSTTRLKWEVQLGQALSEFETGLTIEQKDNFQALRVRTVGSPPTLRDVMQLTAEVDMQARREKRATHQCFGPRFSKFLEVVQQFASIGDVVIGGSQNLIACGVWALVRTTLLTACKLSSYLEGLSMVFMKAGQSAPQLQKIAALYPNSAAIQEKLARYFMCVIKLCQKIISLCGQSFAGQVKSFFRDWDVAAFETDLASRAAEVHQLMSIEHAHTTSDALSKLDSLSASKVSRRAQKDHYRILNLCSTYDYMSTWKRIRKIGNTAWDFAQAKYDQWMDNSHSSTLIIRGKLGSGKSVLLANMIDDLHLKKKGCKIAYFFCVEDDARSLESRTIMGSLIRQLLELLPPKETSTHMDVFVNADSKDLLKGLQTILRKEERLILVLDGIEACVHEERTEVLNDLARIQKHFNVALCISSSINASADLFRDTQELSYKVWTTLPDQRPEISNFVKGQLDQRLESGRLCIGDLATRFEIEKALLAGHQGMFLWVQLQLEAICLEKTDNNILEALVALPKTLPELFDRILSRYREFAPKHQAAVLDVLIAAVRPLNLDELREAMSVIPGETEPTAGHAINDVRSVLSSCGSLVMIDEEQNTVHFVHQSVQQFLIDTTHSRPGYSRQANVYTVNGAHRRMGDIIVTYLSLVQLNTAMVPMAAPKPSIPLADVPKRVLESTVLSSIPTQLQIKARKIWLKEQKHRQNRFAIANESSNSQDESTTFDYFHFHQYAREYWLHHTKAIHQSSQDIFELFRALIQNADLFEDAALWRTNPPNAPVMENIVTWARLHSHTAILVAEERLVVRSPRRGESVADYNGVRVVIKEVKNYD